MKTIVRKDNNLSIFLFDDNETVIFNNDNIIVGNPARFIVADLNIDNSFLIENITAPNDWYGCKYYYSDNTWTLKE
jgi:hypothetical protein